MRSLKSFRYECLHCGACCAWPGGAPLYPDDVERMAARLALSVPDFIRQCTDHVVVTYEDEETTLRVPYLVLKRNADGCIFVRDGLCSVHEFKPWHCAASPFLAEFVVEPTGRRLLEEKCPGFDGGERHPAAKIRRLLNEQSDREVGYEARLEELGWDLARLYGVPLGEPREWTAE